MRRGAMILAVVAAALAASVAAAQDFKDGLVKSGTLTVGTSGSAPPFSMTNASGELEGFDVDVMTAVGEKLGVPVTFRQLDFAGLLPG